MDKSFKTRCGEVADAVGIDVAFYEGREPEFSAIEDDGYLHITKGGIQASFDVGRGQSLSGKEQNENTVKVIDLLKIKSRVDSGKIMVDETSDEDDDDFCPHCGK